MCDLIGGFIVFMISVFIIIGGLNIILTQILEDILVKRINDNKSYEAILINPKKYNIEIIDDDNKKMIKAFYISTSKDNLKSLFYILNHFEKEGWKIKEETKESAKFKMHYVVLEKVS